MPVIFSNASVCDGGDHVSVDVRFNGSPVRRYTFEVEKLRAPLSEISDDDWATFALMLAKVKAIGATPAQVRTAFRNGFSVTV